MSFTKFDLNHHVYRLLMAEPFWAALSRQIDKVACSSVPTAGVRISPAGRYEMVYNPEFMEQTIKECAKVNDDPFRWVVGVLKHEFYHLIFGHVSTRKPVDGMTMRHNIAMDLAINSHIADELPPNCCLPGRGEFADLPSGLTYEAYLSLLPEEMGEGDEGGEGEGDEGGEGGEGQGTGKGHGQIDDHSGWSGEEGGEGGSQAIADHRLKDALKKAHNEANAKGWGSVSTGMRERINDILATRIDWRKVLRSFVRASIKANRRSTVRRINKRFPYIHAGKRSERVAKLAISIDQSGSVGNGLLAAFFAELQSLSALVEITIVPFDTRVDPELVFVWKKGEKRHMERVMCGGTCFNAPTKYVNEHNFDGHIILTDMEAPKPVASKCQRMWMTNSAGMASSFDTSERIIEVTD